MPVKPVPITRKHALGAFPARARDSHKGRFGTVGVIGGNYGMVGAAILAGRAALKLGAGSVHIGLLADRMPLVDMRVPELMLHPAAALLEMPLDAVVVGNGMGRGLPAQKMLFDAIRLPAALVLDADALNILSERPDLRGMLFERKHATVLTPHPGEAARLLHSQTEEVQAARVASVLEIAQRHHASVVLKGADSLVAARDGKVYVNRTGNPGMSAAGMGDALAGMVAAFIAQGMDADAALLLAVHLHGTAGDALAEQVAAIGMSATEVTEWSRWLLNQWLK